MTFIQTLPNIRLFKTYIGESSVDRDITDEISRHIPNFSKPD